MNDKQLKAGEFFVGSLSTWTRAIQRRLIASLRLLCCFSETKRFPHSLATPHKFGSQFWISEAMNIGIFEKSS
jgi:hypothetical protein